MTDYTPPPVGVSITVPLVGYVSNVKDGVVSMTLRNGNPFQIREPTWEFAIPDWLPGRFGDIVETSGDDPTRYLFIGGDMWVNSKTGETRNMSDEELSRCRLLDRRSN